MPQDFRTLENVMNAIEPGAWRGAPVGIRDIRKALHLDKAAFDALVLKAAAAGRLSLHRHDQPTALSPAQRDELVTDGQSFFIVAALRPHT